MNRLNLVNEEDVSHARDMFQRLKSHLTEIVITVHEDKRDIIWLWLQDRRNITGFFLSEWEYNTLNKKGYGEPSMEEILASIRRIISEEPYTTLRFYFHDKSDAIKFKLVWMP
jgi:hypothetical protein